MSEDGSDRRIALLLHALHGGGAERVMVNVANAIAERGHAVDFLLGNAEGPYLSDVAGEVNVIDFGKRHTSRAFPQFVRYLRTERPVALLSTIAHVNILAIRAAKIAGTGVRVVVRETNTHSLRLGSETGMKAGLIRRLIGLSYPHADAVIAPSQGVLEDLATQFGVARGKMHQIYSPTVSEGLARQAEKPLPDTWFQADQPPVILSVGRLSVQKDYGTLLRAFAEVRARVPVRLMILGEGEERPALENLIGELDIGEDVRMPGFVENPFQYMSRARVFALSSRWEGLPNVLIEALACGSPIVSTDCPSGPREILDGGKYGRLVPPRDVDALAAALSESVNESFDAADRRRQKGRAADFSVERTADKYLDVLLPDRGERETESRLVRRTHTGDAIESTDGDVA